VTLVEASLTDAERRALQRFVGLLEDRLGPRLRSVWLYGSRARGEPPHPESDIDVLVVADPVHPDDDLAAIDVAWQALDEERVTGTRISTRFYDPERLARRREIQSFFIQEVDRDKIVLSGEP